MTATFPVDRSCQYDEGSFPYFKGLADSVMYGLAISDNSVSTYVSDICLYFNPGVYWCICRVMNGINAPKVVECLGSDGLRYRQLAKSGNDDLRQDAVRVSTCL